MSDNAEKIKKIIFLAIFVFCCLMAVTRIAVHGRAGSLAAVSGLLECLVWAVVAGMIGVYLFLGRISESFGNFIFGGKEYLDNTPMSLSHVRGFIAAGDYEQAALLIQELYAQFPNSPELNAVIFEFYCDCCNKRMLAKEFAGNYLKSTKTASAENIVILLRYCDLCREFGMDNDEIIDFLLDQSTKKIYSEPDKKRIFERVKGLSS